MVELAPWTQMAAIALMRIIAAGAFLWLALPWLMFPQRTDRESDPWLARAIWMVFLATVLAHLLSAMKMFEAVLFLAFCLTWATLARTRGLPADQLRAWRVKTVGKLYDALDGRRASRDRGPASDDQGPASRDNPPVTADEAQRPRQTRRSVWNLMAWLLLLAALALSARLLFTEAFITPAPAFSDAPVNIAWVKYMEGGQLYHDGVYPMGMYATLSLLRKFTTLNVVVLLDLCGPLIGLALLLSVLFFVYKSTRSPGAVLVAAILYGVLPNLLPLDLARHAGHQSEEYGLIFVLPAAWYAFAYLLEGRAADRATAAAAAGVAAFTHPLPALLAVVGMAVTGTLALLQGGKAAWRRLPSLVAWVGGAGAASCLALGIGLACGRSWHGASLKYLGMPAGALPPAKPMYLYALGLSAALTAILMLISWLSGGRTRQGAAWLSAAAGTAAACMFLYLLPQFGVASQALADRGGEFGAIGLAVAAALSWTVLERFAGGLLGLVWRPLHGLVRPTSLLACVLVGVLLWRAAPPLPARPYHYFTGEMIRLYLRAEATYIPGDWTLVTGFRGYSLAFGRALHMYPDEFVNMARQMPGDVDAWYETPWTELTGGRATDKTPYYILLVERTSPVAANPSEAEPVLAQARQLAQWIADARGRLPLQHLFSNDNIDAWVLEIPFPKLKPEGLAWPSLCSSFPRSTKSGRSSMFLTEPTRTPTCLLSSTTGRPTPRVRWSASGPSAGRTRSC